MPDFTQYRFRTTLTGKLVLQVFDNTKWSPNAKSVKGWRDAKVTDVSPQFATSFMVGGVEPAGLQPAGA